MSFPLVVCLRTDPETWSAYISLIESPDGSYLQQLSFAID